jgi:hypothetical protein
MNTSATVKYIYVTGWEVRTENISARDRRSGDASETEGKYFSRQKVFPWTEISLVDRRDLGDRDIDGQPTSIKVSLKCHRWHFLLQAGNWRFRIA